MNWRRSLRPWPHDELLRFLMTGILVIAHAPLASALGKCAEHVYSCDPDARRLLRVLDVNGAADLPDIVERARELMREVDRGEGVLVLTDVIGATPGNVAALLGQSEHVKVLAGVNLPMLLRAVCYRSDSLDDLAQKALTGGQQGMQQVEKR